MDRKYNDICILRNTEGATYLTFKPLEQFEWLIHGFSTRLGGVSKGGLTSLNLGYERGDNPDNVDRNWELLGQAARFDTAKLSFPNQWHTDNVRIAGQNTWACGNRPDKDSEPIDAQITDSPGTVLVTYGADCTPVMLVDVRHRAIGQCHCGWKGTINGITEKTLKMMSEQYGTTPDDITAVIGPSIGPKVYEVGNDVADRFIERYGISVTASSPVVRTGVKPGKYMLDLWEANHRNLIALGISPDKIFTSGICTFTEKELMYSHRRDGNDRGVMAAFMCIDER